MMRGDSGMTLMELLIVISILGLLVTVVLPFSGRMSDNTKREETIQLLESIRYGLLGAENAYDANGYRVLGGYVGDFGTLPAFVVHHWDTATNSWIVQESSSGSDEPEVVDFTASIEEDNYDVNIMPVGLWNNNIRIPSAATDPHELVPHEDWNGPYVVPPRDDFTNDDDIYTYTRGVPSPGSLNPVSSPYTDTERHFLLRQGGGRLTDGWGSSLIVYFDNKKNLYFVSAGSDRRINYGNPALLNTDDFGPADTSLPNNEDNLVLIISHEQWNLTDQKVTQTKQILQDMKSAILGRSGMVTDGVSQPNGFVADMGSLELLTGSYVFHGTHIYKCTDSAAATSAPPSAGWDVVTDGSLGNEAINYPFVQAWVAGRKYYAPRPYLLLMNSDYVKIDIGGGEYKFYRCIQDATGQSPTDANSSYWVEDDIFENPDLVPTYSTTVTYLKNAITPWRYFNNVGFGAGWRGPYTSSNMTNINDAWGDLISLELSNTGYLIRSTNTDSNGDVIVENINRTDFEVSVKVQVKPSTSPTVAVTTADRMSIYTVFNGDVAYFDVEADASLVNGTDAQFQFTNDGRATINPSIIGNGLDVTLAVSPTPSAYPAGNGVYLPVGKVMAVFRQLSTSFASPAGYQETFIIHQRTDPTLIMGD